MDWIKKNWFWLIAVPVVGFFIYRYISAKLELSDKMKGVRAARNNNHVSEEVIEPKEDVEES